MERTRFCIKPDVDSEDCNGMTKVTAACNERPCPGYSFFVKKNTNDVENVTCSSFVYLKCHPPQLRLHEQTKGVDMEHRDIGITMQQVKL